MTSILYRKITLDGDISLVPDAIDYYENELKEARKECNISGSLEQSAARLPGIFEHRYAQLQEVEGIYRFLDTELKKLRGIHFRKYLEHYNRQLGARDAEKYIDAEDDVITYTHLVGNILVLRDQFLGISKALDHKNWQISNIVKLKVAGLDDARV